MGRETYICNCGQRYLTGATEWDHLGNREQKQRVGKTILLGVIFSAFISLLGIVVYLALRFGFGLRKEALLAAIFLTALPFILVQLTFWLGVAASMWRTRMRSRELEGR
jgi:cation transporter-like permease